ncbi:Glutamyl-tRNA(Gln) amidotransferase subunit C [bacterium HR20]|jgi:aspartyl-tRNA(Asn)/glutamyl-tRNA(Gln) amidotransferase subunit C|nr:Glutamyl-tRNA(Gln) amidotransferase subunit C [bacterium HR20]
MCATLPHWCVRHPRRWFPTNRVQGVISVEELRRIAALAKLSFSDEEIERFRAEFERIVEYVSALDRIRALDELEPLDSVVSHTNAFADDVPHQSLSTAEALANAPRHNESFFKVPKVIASEWTPDQPNGQ